MQYEIYLTDRLKTKAVAMSHRMLVFILILPYFFSCRQSPDRGVDQPSALTQPPKQIELRPGRNYIINPVTGDSVIPWKNSSGELVKTGIEVPASKPWADTGFLLPPVSIAARWVLSDTLVSYRLPIAGKPDTIVIDQNTLLKVKIVNDASSKVFRRSDSQAVLTGIPLPAKGDVVSCKMPPLKRMLPMSLRPDSRYNIRELNTYHGLPSSSVFHMMEDSRGNLWFSSMDGLVCYDGQYSQIFNKESGLLADYVFYSFEDSKGNIWMHNVGKGVSCYNGRNFIQFKSARTGEIGIGGSDGFAEDSKGNIWIKSFVDGVSKFDGKNFTHYTTKEGLASNVVRGMLIDSKDRIWLGSRKGISIIDGTDCIRLSKADGLNHDVVNTIREDSRGNVWIGTDSGLAVYNGKTLVRLTKGNGLSGNFIGDIEEDSDGNMWISTYDNGVTCFDGKEFLTLGASEGLAGTLLHNLLPGRNGGCWFASGKGISYFNENHFERLNELPGYAKRTPNSILVDQSGSLIFGDRDFGLFRKRGNILFRLADKDSVTKGNIRPLLLDKAGRIWYYVRRFDSPLKSGLACFDGDSIRFYRSGSGQLNDFVRSVMEDSDGGYWVSTSKGILLIKERTLQWITEKQGLSSNQVFTVMESKDGNKWIASFGGLTRFSGENFIHYTENEGLPGNLVTNVVEDGRGGLWFSTSNGIVYMFRGEMFVFANEQGLPPGKTYHVAGIDKQQNVWLSTNTGICRVPAGYVNILGKKGAGRAQRDLLVFTERDGLLMPLSIIGNISADSLFILAHNTSETSILNISNLDKANKSVSVTIKNLVVNNVNLDFHGSDRNGRAETGESAAVRFANLPVKLVLPHDQNDLAFQFAPVGEYVNQQLMFSYTLDGLGEGWSNPSPEPSARYHYLPPGEYTFLVRALNRQGVWGPPATYQFTIQHPFWQEWWFQLTFFVLIGGSVYFLVARRVRAIRQRDRERLEAEQKISDLEYRNRQAVLDERLRISSELHDEVGATLSGISMYSHLAKEQMKNSENPAMKHSLNIIQHNAGEMVNKLNDIVWLINPGNDNLQRLLQRLEDYAIQMAAVKNIRVISNINGHHSRSMLSAATRRNIYLLFKEAINNSVKYSHATQLEFNIHESIEGVTLVLSDNGDGFDLTLAKRGNGLANMEARAAEIAAEFQYSSAPGEGTSVRLHLPQSGIEMLG